MFTWPRIVGFAAGIAFAIYITHDKRSGPVDLTRMRILPLTQLAEKGNLEAQAILGERFLDGNSVHKNPEIGLKWLRKSAEAGYAPAQHDLATYYTDGKGVPTNKQEAIFWFRRAAANNWTNSIDSLGVMYAMGDGVEHDYAEAFRCFQKAAVLGHATAAEHLGGAYALGQGVHRDDVEAYRWLTIAIQRGERGAERLRNKLVARMKPEQIADAENSATQTPRAVRYD